MREITPHDYSVNLVFITLKWSFFVNIRMLLLSVLCWPQLGRLALDIVRGKSVLLSFF